MKAQLNVLCDLPVLYRKVLEVGDSSHTSWDEPNHHQGSYYKWSALPLHGPVFQSL
ncbi:uncharacterized protein PHALS_00968 [Plasmopara halstedii]|uniref:Uncharacterized protein n=1 Tax=Plasmopara halstedii TaxID=4781 RepID=A0A0P1ATJ9_PLAHL|nr:uncharacterized protein PHALS_00968 [Plasmopara halstedii]CEG44622.1 hypothetical protein PHALS_00968 [Plasmopara halstedii]|eukprot:XP_024580991.1 hypothetical protein PHALS_00968 [Plasmopara halstedii]